MHWDPRGPPSPLPPAGILSDPPSHRWGWPGAMRSAGTSAYRIVLGLPDEQIASIGWHGSFEEIFPDLAVRWCRFTDIRT